MIVTYRTPIINRKVSLNSTVRTTNNSNFQPEITNNMVSYNSIPYYSQYIPVFKGNTNELKEKEIINKIEEISEAKAEEDGEPLKYLTSTYVFDAEGKEVPVLAFRSKYANPDFIKISLFTTNGYEVGNIACILDYQQGTAADSKQVKNPFIKKGQKYAYLCSMDNYYNIKSLPENSYKISRNWQKEITSGKEPQKLKYVATRLYGLLAGYMEKNRMDDIKGLLGHAREDGSFGAHGRIGFSHYDESYKLKDKKFPDGMAFIGVYMDGENFNNLKQEGKALLEGLPEIVENREIQKKTIDKVNRIIKESVDGNLKPTEEKLDILLKDNNWNVRIGTIKALRETGKFEHTKLLEPLNTDEDYNVRKSASEAIMSIYERTANQGNTNSQYALGNFYSKKGNSNKSEYWYEQAANQGNADAQYELVELYMYTDAKKKIYWLKEAIKNVDTSVIHKKKILKLKRRFANELNIK